ncbi:protein argonaute-2 isoform X2 [Armigeres subalbatus]|uniref:protein argonaute-2 isoform X2 n=1 Tax=Armigeres subalbatus TaxID=124917 RepID=UPI002ED0A3BE
MLLKLFIYLHRKQQQLQPTPSESSVKEQGSEPMATQQPQQKGKYKQKKQQQQQEQGTPVTESTAEQQPDPDPMAEQHVAQKGKYKQKLQQKQQTTGDHPGEATQQQPTQDQGKMSYKLKQQQKQQKQQQQQQQQQKPQSDQGKNPYKQRQQQQQHPSQEQSSGLTTPSSHSSSPSHAAALERVAEDFCNIKIDKQKIHSSKLLPVLVRANAHGTRGKMIKVEVNYIQLFVDRLIPTAYHYDVDIQPPASRKWQRLAFSEFCREMFPNHGLAFDGHKNAYSARRLKADHYEKEIKVRGDGRDRKFTVAMKEAAVLDMSCLKTYMTNGNGTNLDKPMSAIQCLDIVLRTAYENNPRFIKFKKSIYVKPERPDDLGSNHELWYGLFQSALLGAKPFLNIDVSHKAFPSGGPVLNVLRELNRGQIPDRPIMDWMSKELHDFLKGMELAYTGPDGVSKLFKYNAIKLPANTQKFKLEDGTVMTIDQYFRSKKMQLKYPYLPALHVGSTIKNIMLPIELCSIPPGQALNKKHPDSCTQHIIKKSATDTATRKRKIMDLFNQINYNNAPTIKEFGVGVGNNFEAVDGRIIDPPELSYANNKNVRPSKGVWRADNLGYIVPSTAVTRRSLNWTILNLDQRTRPDAIQEFGRNIYQMSQKQNVLLQPFSMRDNFYEPRDMRTCIKELDFILNDIKQSGIDLAFVIIPNPGRDGDVYAKVKQKAELCVGLFTQCIKSFTLDRKRGDPSTISNIWLKINAKTNGSNHVLASSYKPPIARKTVMYIGADVTHPSPEQTNIPSVVGVAASYDLEGFRFNCCYRLQNAKDEMIRDLQNIVVKQLRQFKQQNQKLPELIMYYRDGVSEGQFQEVLTVELRAMQAAAASVAPNYKPNITFIVVQKRHHARFFPTDKCPTEGRNNNVPPGTIVDKYITTPNQYQFFLVSHAAVQGVAKPTKYCVLYDDENCNPDQLQALTYYLCHMFTRCNRAVSYPAPTYYAHLAAYRGRVYIKDRNLNMTNLVREYENMQIKSEIQDGHPMFFV